jgi:hypothetical protein
MSIATPIRVRGLGTSVRPAGRARNPTFSYAGASVTDGDGAAFSAPIASTLSR